MKEFEKPMYYGAKPSTFRAAHQLRDRMTYSEILLWEKLKLKQISGLRFRRQHPIDFFIVDFYCHEARLVIEVDGEVHELQKEYDDGRSAEMERYFIKVLRFSNIQVEENIDFVVGCIRNEVKGKLESPPWGI